MNNARSSKEQIKCVSTVDVYPVVGLCVKYMYGGNDYSQTKNKACHLL